MRSTHDIRPTLTDAQIVEFCKQGYLLLEGVVDPAVNARANAYAEKDPSLFPNAIMQADWFVDGVLLNPAAAGAVRSLLGRDFRLPALMVNHRRTCPFPTNHGWHVDGGSRWGPELNDLQVFYLPQETPRELGPTELIPGSHLAPNTARIMAHYDAIRGSVPTAARAGSIFLTAYRIWHRAGSASGTGVRNLFKYCYSRTTPPTRDWAIDPNFDLSAADFSGPATALGEQFHECFTAARMFTWLCGKAEHHAEVGGQGWPVPGPRAAPPYGFSAALATKGQ
ncbi:MAG: phytanoyl-CoA dioxygenase family protein [Planctomycetota bacterium]|nr:phytanoyl-CoA dioxygenase family protein [Planctomycetota bacterium]